MAAARTDAASSKPPSAGIGKPPPAGQKGAIGGRAAPQGAVPRPPPTVEPRVRPGFRGAPCQKACPAPPAATAPTPCRGPDPSPLRFQVTELPPVKPEVTEYQRHRLVCSRGASDRGPLPAGVSGQDGPRWRACVVLPTGQYRLSKENAVNLTGDLFGAPLSAGAGRASQPVADEILAAARTAAANIDETSVGKGRWLRVMGTAVGTAF